MLLNKAVFFDRDGTLIFSKIIKGQPIAFNKLQDIKIIPGIKETISKIKKFGYLCIMITNQPDVSRKKVSKSEVIEINDYLIEELSLDDCFVCFHDDADFCECRKPLPGMLFEASRKWNINLSSSYMVGDRWRDVNAGKKAQCETILIDYNYKENIDIEPDYVIDEPFDILNIICP